MHELYDQKLIFTVCSIVGLYSTFIILIAQLVRDVLVGSSTKIIYQELPNVDKILQLLNDILLVRSLVLLDLEDELYEKLIHIYRDPAFMFHITKCNRKELERRRLKNTAVRI